MDDSIDGLRQHITARRRSLVDISESLFFCMELLGWSQAQGVVVFVEFEAEGFDDEVVVFALGQAGDGD
jgi:hypothetical protein